MNPRRTITTSQAARALGFILGTLTLILLLQYPEIFVWVIVLGGFIACAVWIVALHEQRDNIAREWADHAYDLDARKRTNRLLVATNVQLLTENRELSEANAAIVARLAEVIEEHADCPAPVALVTDRMVEAARAASATPNRCSCGSDATSLNPSEVIVHRTDGRCTIEVVASPASPNGGKR